MRVKKLIGLSLRALILSGAALFVGCTPPVSPPVTPVKTTAVTPPQCPNTGAIPTCAGCKFQHASSLAIGTMTSYPQKYTVAQVGRNRNVALQWIFQPVSMPQINVRFTESLTPAVTQNAEMDFFYPSQAGAFLVCQRVSLALQ
jgi:hypothetical protein